MKSPTYKISGPPIPQPRARILRNGIHYDPRAKDKQKIRILLLSQRNSFNQHMLTCPVSLQATFFMPIPTSLSKKKQSSLVGQPCTKKNGDLDNLLKTLLDTCAFNGPLVLDDSLVYSLSCQKIYDPDPRTEFHFIYGSENENKVNT